MTVFEALEDAGLVHRRGEHHVLPRPHAAPARRCPASRGRCSARAASSSTTSSSRIATGAPLAVSATGSAGTIDGYATAVGALARHARRLRLPRLLPLRLRLRLARARPGRRARRARALRRGDRGLVEAAGGLDEFLERYAVIVCSDHGQTAVRRWSHARGCVRRRRRRARHRLQPRGDGLPAPGCREDRASSRRAARRRRRRSTSCSSARATRRSPAATAKSSGSPADDGGWATSGDPVACSTTRTALERAGPRSPIPNAGELIVSAAEGWEFADLGGPSPPGWRLATARSSRATPWSRC